MNTPMPLTDDALQAVAMDFARAALDWRRLSTDRTNWIAPERQREMAQVFLRYHSAKLALEDLTHTGAN